MKLNLFKGKPTQNMQYLTIFISLMLISCCIQMDMNSQKMKLKEKLTSNNEALPTDFNNKSTQTEKSTQSEDDTSTLTEVSLLELSQKSKKTTETKNLTEKINQKSKRLSRFGINKISKKSDLTNWCKKVYYTKVNEGLESNSKFRHVYNCGSNCKFDGEFFYDFWAICNGIKCNDKINTLSLINGGLNDKSMELLSEVLMSDNNITTLDLSNNIIGNKGAKFISESLKNSNNKIKKLNLSNNQIGNEGANLILEAIKHENSKVEEINLNDNKSDYPEKVKNWNRIEKWEKYSNKGYLSNIDSNILDQIDEALLKKKSS